MYEYYDKKCSLAKEKYDSELKRQWAEKVKSISAQNCKEVRLNRTVKTTPIMDDFFHSKKDFLVFKSAFHRFDGKRYYDISLIIMNEYSNVKARTDSQFTMTELKNNYNKLACFEYFPYRMKNLIKEIGDIISNADYKYGDVIVFDPPFKFGAQTYADQTGFGDIYYFGELYEEGTKYGDTTDFYVVGFML